MKKKHKANSSTGAKRQVKKWWKAFQGQKLRVICMFGWRLCEDNQAALVVPSATSAPPGQRRISLPDNPARVCSRPSRFSGTCERHWKWLEVNVAPTGASQRGIGRTGLVSTERGRAAFWNSGIILHTGWILHLDTQYFDCCRFFFVFTQSANRL